MVQKHLHQRVPSLLALTYLEAVVRLGSFTAAARELHVSQSAVSQQIKGLEEELGLALFERTSSGVRPQVSALELASQVRKSLEEIAHVAERWGAAALSESDTSQLQLQREIVLGVPPSLANMWLLPRLANFRRLHPTWRIRPDISIGKHDLSKGEVHACVRYGMGNYSDVMCQHLSSEHLVCVCSPELLERHGSLTSMNVFQAYTSSTPRQVEPVLGWSKATGVNFRGERISFNRQSMAVLAALQGEGAAVVPYQLVRDELEDGRLVCPVEQGCKDEMSYYLVWNHRTSNASVLSVLSDWFINEFLGV